ncbi:MAG: L-threonylcarbamoyladenylate synthase [Candidatus Omnitrophota bacterium]|nr:threonylcarbamoyl-AMP synthase [Candidatus Omnitrophota bacterium]
MRPYIIKIDPYNIDQEALNRAAEIIHNRGLVAFPTETVYGLGADATDPKAVAGIFEAKKRPLDDPIIVHIAEIDDLARVSEKAPPLAYKLVERFWPGPLTVVLKKTDIIPDIVSSGLDTVAVRMPSNEIARGLIKAAGVPIAAPSANLFSRPSPTKAEHVLNDLEGRIDMILDGGPTEIGVESTVIEVIGSEVNILRPGGVSVEDLRRMTKNVNVPSDQWHQERSPGKYPQHYSPQAKIVLVPDRPDQDEKVMSYVAKIKEQNKTFGIMAKQEHEDRYRGFNVKILGPGRDSRICASRLFSILREFDKEEVDIIIAEGIPEKGLGLAVMNRLRKAAGPVEMFFNIFHNPQE